MKNHKSEIGTVLMMIALIVMTIIGFSSQKFLSSKKVIRSKAQVQDPYSCTNAYLDKVNPNFCGGALACGHTSFWASGRCFRCVGPNFDRANDDFASNIGRPNVGYPANMEIKPVKCCGEHKQEMEENGLGEVCSGFVSTGASDGADNEGEVTDLCKEVGGKCLKSEKCGNNTNNDVDANNYCDSLGDEGEFVCCGGGTTNTCLDANNNTNQHRCVSNIQIDDQGNPDANKSCNISFPGSTYISSLSCGSTAHYQICCEKSTAGGGNGVTIQCSEEKDCPGSNDKYVVGTITNNSQTSTKYYNTTTNKCSDDTGGLNGKNNITDVCSLTTGPPAGVGAGGKCIPDTNMGDDGAEGGGKAPCGGVLIYSNSSTGSIFRECPSTGETCRYSCFNQNDKRINCPNSVKDLHGSKIRKVSIVNFTGKTIIVIGAKIQVEGTVPISIGDITISENEGKNFFTYDFQNKLTCSGIDKFIFSIDNAYIMNNGADYTQLPAISKSERCAGVVNILISIRND